MDWINIKIQEPDHKEPIVYMRPGNKSKHYVGIAYWTVSHTWNPEMESIQNPKGFTHWIPLPKLP